MHFGAWWTLAFFFPLPVLGLVAFAELLTPLSQAQVRATMVSILKQLGVPADQWRKGGTYSTMLTVTAGVISMFLGLLAQGLGAGFLETASGGWLTLLAYYVYGVTRPSATFATGQLTLTNTSVQPYTYPANQATFANPVSGAQYTNSQGFTLAANSTLSIPITATQAGAASSSTSGTITTVVTGMLGVTCTNAAAVVGLDAMGDPQLRQLCLAALGAMSVRGPRNAYAYAIQVATNAVTGAPVNINRWWISGASHTGIVTVYVASPSGVPDPNDVAGVVTSIENLVRPDAVTVVVIGATAIPYAPTVNVWCTAQKGLTQAAVFAAVQSAISNYIAAYPIGGLPKLLFPFVLGNTLALETGIFASGVDGAIREANPGIYAIDGTVDLTLVLGQVVTDNVQVNVFMVAPPGAG